MYQESTREMNDAERRGFANAFDPCLHIQRFPRMSLSIKPALLRCVAVMCSICACAAFAKAPPPTRVSGAGKVMLHQILKQNTNEQDLINQPYTTQNVTLVINSQYIEQVTFGCPYAETVTPFETGAPTSGGATAVWDPDPTTTGESNLTLTTTLTTDPGVYDVVITGQGTVCGAYQPSDLDMTYLPEVAVERLNLTTVETGGYPQNDGGTFSNATDVLSGSTNAPIGFATGYTATSNPNEAVASDPENPCAGGVPCPGGLENVTTKFDVNQLTGTNPNSANYPNPPSYKVATFGMSCYFTTLESDWGTPPNDCESITIGGTTYSGTVTNPAGYPPGTYCSAFVAEVELQGSGVLNSGQDMQYINGSATQVSQIDAADGTAVVANETVARDRNIIPDHNTYIDLDQVGTGLLANDTGGAINGYRIDLYKGNGKSVCANYDNVMAVGACETSGQPNCPAGEIQ